MNVKSKLNKIQEKQIRVDRDSVCMADDCTAPNEKWLNVEDDDMISDMFQKVALYLPKLRDAIWAVDSGEQVLGYIFIDGDITHYEFCQKDCIFSNLKIEALHCSHFYLYSFYYRNGKNGELIEKYPECKTLLEKVKCCMKERFEKNSKK